MKVGAVLTLNLGVKFKQKLKFNVRDMLVYLVTSYTDRNKSNK